MTIRGSRRSRSTSLIFKCQDGTHHNVVFLATMGNHVWAFDADAQQGKDLLWKTDQRQRAALLLAPLVVQHKTLFVASLQQRAERRTSRRPAWVGGSVRCRFIHSSDCVSAH